MMFSAIITTAAGIQQGGVGMVIREQNPGLERNVKTLLQAKRVEL